MTTPTHSDQTLLYHPREKGTKSMVRNGYNQTSFKRRFQMVSIRLARARRLGHNPWFVLFNNPHYFTQLLPERPLDGLSLYRQSAAKLTIPKQILTAQTRTIMVISHC